MDGSVIYKSRKNNRSTIMHDHGVYFTSNR